MGYHLTLSIEQGEFVAIVGTSGSVQIRDKELAELNDEQLTIFRRRNIGFIFQNYNLVPVLNVYENIVLPVELPLCKEENRRHRRQRHKGLCLNIKLF